MRRFKFSLTICILLASCSGPAPQPPSDPEERFLFDRKDHIEQKVLGIYVNQTYPVYAFVSTHYSKAHKRNVRSVCGVYHIKQEKLEKRDFYFVFPDWEGYFDIGPGTSPDKGDVWYEHCSERVRNAAGQNFQIEFPEPSMGFSLPSFRDTEEERLREVVIDQALDRQ